MLTLQNLSKYYSRNGTVALGLRKINLSLNRGEFVAIVGESGSGKSTLLNVICGLDTYEDGEFLINGEATSHFNPSDWENYRRNDVGFVFQDYNIIESFTVLQNVESALILIGYEHEQRRQRALELIERVGLSSYKDTKASKLSGGQMQRTVIARALAKDSPIIAADEPTGNLDSKSSEQIINLLAEISKDKLVMVVTHNFEELQHVATRKITIHDGEVVEDQQLQTIANSEEIANRKQVDHRAGFRDLLLMAFQHVTATPFKSLLMFSVLLLLSLGAAFIYGSTLNFKDALTVSNANPYFPNSADNRIVINKPDRTSFASKELDELSALPDIKELIKGDLALDQQLTVELPRNLNKKKLAVSSGLMPWSSIKKNDLRAGKLPETAGEIVMNTLALRNGVDEKDILNKTFNFTFDSQVYALKVVGIADNKKLGEWLYADAGTLESIAKQAAIPHSTLLLSLDDRMTIPVVPMVTTELAQSSSEGVVGINAALASLYCQGIDLESQPCENTYINKPAKVEVTGLYSRKQETFTIGRLEGEQADKEMPAIFLHPKAYDELLQQQEVVQISLFLKEPAASGKLMALLKEKGYSAFYPYETLEPTSRLLLVVQYLLLAVFLVGTLAVFFFITYFILGTIVKSKRHNYIIMRSIGASQGFVHKMVFLELFMISTAAYMAAWLISMISGWLPTYPVTKSIADLFTNYGWLDYIYLYLILIMITVLLASRMRKKMFNDSVMTTLKGEEGQ